MPQASNKQTSHMLATSNCGQLPTSKDLLPASDNINGTDVDTSSSSTGDRDLEFGSPEKVIGSSLHSQSKHQEKDLDGDQKRRMLLLELSNRYQKHTCSPSLASASKLNFGELSDREEFSSARATIDTLPSSDTEANEMEAMGCENPDHKEGADPKKMEYVDMPNDAYAMLFLSNFGDKAFFYSIYIFVLKMSLFSILAAEVLTSGYVEIKNPLVIAAQILLLPVAVGLQTDLITTVSLVANVKYCSDCKLHNKGASKSKYFTSVLLRGLDGSASLLVNYVVFLKSLSVKELFLNFAALHFLQSIDDVALELAANGFIGDVLEDAGKKVQELKLPCRTGNDVWRHMDSIFFVAIVALLSVVWVWYVFTREGPLY